MRKVRGERLEESNAAGGQVGEPAGDPSHRAVLLVTAAAFV